MRKNDLGVSHILPLRTYIIRTCNKYTCSLKSKILLVIYLLLG